MRKFLTKCTVTVCVIFILGLHYYAFNSSPDEIKAAAAASARSEGQIYLSNDKPFEPMVIHQSQMGQIMVCMATDLRSSVKYRIIKRLFLGGKSRVLIRCEDGKITIGPVKQA